ncbi:MAG TPA: hypothetical protein PLK69_02200 [Tetrasphaera sp.]|nr:hypothetical protein [Tetrasphaera sp.]
MGSSRPVAGGTSRAARPLPVGRYRLRRLLIGSAVAALLVALAGLGLFTVRWASGPTCQARAGGSTFAFTPEQTGHAATITAEAIRRGLPARAATIALATALQESGLRNLDYGDRDSVGLFQQRPSQGWGSVPQIMDPTYAAGAFYDALVKVDDYESRPITEVAQEVQRSAFPTAYADHEGEGRVLASTLTGHSPAGLGCRLGRAAAADPAQVSAVLGAQLGVSATASRGALTVHTSSATRAWQVASWAVAQAERYGIVAVDVADKRWERAAAGASLVWQDTQESADGTTVTLHLAP